MEAIDTQPQHRAPALPDATYPTRVIAERARLATVDPGGETEAVAPVRPPMLPIVAEWDERLATPLPGESGHDAAVSRLVAERADASIAGAIERGIDPELARRIAMQHAELDREELLAEIEEARLERIGPTLLGQPLDTFLAEGAGPTAWFGPIVENGLATFLGAPESFKTFAALQLGLAGAAGKPWLGMELGDPRPFVYVAAEKSRATIRDRLERMTRSMPPIAQVRIVHRAGVTFGDRAAWDRVVELVDALGPRTFVVVDTIASVAGSGFDENSGKDMATVLAALRRLGDTGATVAALHHPNKHGDGSGGVRLRGHSSLWGEADGVLDFTRPDRAVDAAIVRLEPKDGDLRLLHIRWDRDTFLLEPETGMVALTASSLAAVVDALYSGDALTSDRIGAEFVGYGRSIVLRRLSEAVAAGLVARVGAGKSTGYVPVPRLMRVDEPDSGTSGRIVDEPGQLSIPTVPERGRIVDESSPDHSSTLGGSIGPPVDESPPPEMDGSSRPACYRDADLFRAHASIRTAEGCQACEAAA